MAKKMTVADLAPAHINGLKSSLHALEVQITLLKNMITGSEPSEEAEEDAPAPAKKSAAKKAAKPKKEEEEEEFDLDEPEEEEEEIDLDEPEEEEEEEIEEEEDDDLTLDAVTKAFQKFAAKKPANREKAKKILQKFKVKSIRALKPKDFQKALDMLEG